MDDESFEPTLRTDMETISTTTPVASDDTTERELPVVLPSAKVIT
jgi:hypothetical protein